LLLKIPDPGFIERYPEAGQKEVRFYQVLVDGAIELPVPRCYDAVCSEEGKGFHLLLEDLSETHVPLQAPLPPSKSQCEQVVDTLARIHAFWWDHPVLGRNLGTLPSEVPEWDFCGGLGETFPRFVDFVGEGLFDDRREIYERVLVSAPALSKRWTEGKHLTLVHGDAHAWNFLYPRDPDKDVPRLLDWDAWSVSIGPSDLAFLIALFWFPERRARMERTLVKRYHERLLTYGVKGYDWDVCWDDYRLGVIQCLFLPLWWWAHDLSPELWWPRLERVILAFQDLGCVELLT
jgi:Ser/Thr protein kinase RdoA (MazF antagonist)